MIKTFLRASRSLWPAGQRESTKCVCIIQRFASFRTRDIFNETSNETGTLLVQFAKHIAIDGHKHIPPMPTKVRYADYFPVSNMHYFQKELRRTPVDQLPALFVYCATYRPSADPVKYVEVLNELDAYAMQQLHSMDEDTLLRVLYAILYLMPNWITRMDIYHAGIRRLAEKFFTPDAPKETFVQLCFYLGLEKKRSFSQNNSALLQELLERHLDNYLPELSTMDLALVANAAYKTSTKVDNLNFNLRLEEEVQKLPLDATQHALLVTFVKSMRFQRMHSDIVCKRLMELCAQPKYLNKFQPRGLVHLLAYFAETRWDSEDCTQPLVAEFVKRLGKPGKFETPQSSEIRGKDLAMLLWSCAQLNCTLDHDELQSIEDVLCYKVRNDEFRYFSDHLVDCCLSLWSLGYKSRDLLEDAIRLKEDSQLYNRKTREQPKVDSRLIVLRTAAAIEEPNWMPKLSKKESVKVSLQKPVPAYLLNQRSDLQEYVKQLSTEPEVADVKLICPIEGINIPSVLVDLKTPENSQVLVELISAEQTLRFSDDPVSLIRLKTRLLNALGHKVVVLRHRDLLENYTSLKDLVCDNNETGLETEKKEHSVHSI